MTTDNKPDILVRAFATFDRKDTGMITVETLTHLLTKLGQKLSPEEVAEMITEANVIDGKIDYREFSKLILSK